jgi:hypothetical protein
LSIDWIQRIPSNLQARNGNYFYSAKYNLAGRDLLVESAFVFKAKTLLCGDNDDKHWNNFRALVKRDLRQQVI